MSAQGGIPRSERDGVGSRLVVDEAEGEAFVRDLTDDLDASARTAIGRIVEFFRDREQASEIAAPERYHMLHSVFYGRPWLGVADRIRYAREVLDLTGGHGGRILELGAGFGITSVFLALCGSASVVALDIDPTYAEVFRRWMIHLELDHLPVVAVTADCARSVFADATFDVATADGMLSHVSDLGATLAEARRVLKAEGRLYVQDENNALIPEGRLRRRRGKWAVHERAHREARLRLLREFLPDAPEAHLAALAHQTRGLLSHEIRAVARGSSVGRPVTAAPRDPETGVYAEREFSPFGLCRMLRQAGFRPRLAPVFVPLAVARPANALHARLKLWAKTLVSRRPTLAAFLIDSMRIVARRADAGPDHTS